MHTDGPSLRELRVEILDLESAFETPAEQFRHFLDRETGEVLMLPGYGYDGDVTEEMVAAEEAIDEEPTRYLALEADQDFRPSRDRRIPAIPQVSCPDPCSRSIRPSATSVIPLRIRARR